MNPQNYSILKYYEHKLVYIYYERQFYVKKSDNKTGTVYRCRDRSCGARRIISENICVPLKNKLKHNHNYDCEDKYSEFLISMIFRRMIKELPVPKKYTFPTTRDIFNEIEKQFDTQTPYDKVAGQLQRLLKNQRKTSKITGQITKNTLKMPLTTCSDHTI